MMVGPSGSGKTSAWRCLLSSLEMLDGVKGEAHVIDPKAIGWLPCDLRFRGVGCCRDRKRKLYSISHHTRVVRPALAPLRVKPTLLETSYLKLVMDVLAVVTRLTSRPLIDHWSVTAPIYVCLRLILACSVFHLKRAVCFGAVLLGLFVWPFCFRAFWPNDNC